MAKKEDLQVGMHVSALRMHNKAVAIVGTIEKVYDEWPGVQIKPDTNENWLEDAHVDDVTVLPAAVPVTAAQTTQGQASLTMVNGKPV